MFPISMAAQHRHLAGALAKIVSQLDNVDDLTTFLEGLGRDHRKFGVVAEHYDAGGSRACWRPWNISPGRRGRAERLLPGPAFPRYPTVEARVADVCLDVGTAALAAGRGRGSPGQESTRSPGRPSMRRSSPPASSIISTPRSPSTATPRRSPGCCTGSTSRGPEPAASEPCSPAARPRPRSSPHSPARRCPATNRRGPGRRRPGPGPQAGPDGDPCHAGAGDRRPGPGHLCGAESRVGR